MNSSAQPTSGRTNRVLLIRLAKFAVALGLIWAAWRWLLRIKDPGQVWAALRHIPPYVHVLALLAASGNWLLETFKWRVLIQSLEPLRFGKAWKSTMSGAAVSNIIPFRVGEYLGRAFYLSPENRLPAAFNSVFGSMCQMFITLAAGIPAAWFLLHHRVPDLINKAMLALGALVLIAVVLLYTLPRLRARTGWLKKLVEDARNFTFRQIALTILLSALRYGVFGGFYAWLLIHNGIAQPWHAVCGVASIFLLQSFAPSNIITDAGVRTALPLFVFNPAPEQQPLLLALAVLNYFYNVILPALTGLGCILLRKATEA